MQWLFTGYAAEGAGAKAGIRVGIIARDDSAQAWSVARRRFSADRRGQLTRELAMRVSDSVWHRQLSQLANETSSGETPYWLVPFLNYRAFSPYLVGSYIEVAGELKRYLIAGFSTFILDIPPDEEELAHANCAFRRAIAEVYACQHG